MNNTSNDVEIAPVSSSIPELALVLEFGCVLQEMKVDASTLEAALGHVIQRLGLEGTVFALPNGFLTTLRKEGHHSKTYMMRVTNTSPNLSKLADVETLLDLFLEGKLDIATTRERLATLVTQRPRFGFWSKTIACSLAAMGMIQIWNGKVCDILWGALVGIAVGLGINLVEKQAKTASFAPLVAGFISALAASAVKHYMPLTTYSTIVLGGVVCLIPGLELLVAAQELGTGNLVSGTARMSGAGLTFILITLGIYCGEKLGTHYWGALEWKNLTSSGSWIVMISLAIVVLAYLIIFQGRLADYGLTLFVGALTWYSNVFLVKGMGEVVGAGITTLVLGAVCNYYSQRSRNPEAIIMLPSVLLILPGSLGIRSLVTTIGNKELINEKMQILVTASKDAWTGLHLGFRYFYVTIALMLGLLMANALVSRRTF